jgi:predicted transcriptional regulator
MDGEDLTELLRRRHRLLRALAEEPRPRHVLVDLVDDSKSTVYKGLTQLEEAGLIERGEAGFSPTLYGVLALARYDALAGTAAFGDLLDGLSGDAVDPAALVGAEVVRPDETDAERHLDALWRVLDDARSVRGVAPVVSPGYVERFRAYVDGGLEAELVLPMAVVDSLRADPDVLADVAARATLYETEWTVPFGLLVTDGDDPQVVVELRDGPLVTGLVTNDTPAALAWAESTFERFRADAARVTP